MASWQCRVHPTNASRSLSVQSWSHLVNKLPFNKLIHEVYGADCFIFQWGFFCCCSLHPPKILLWVIIWVLLAKEFGDGNGTPLQYSCLENPMDGEAWKAAVHGVAEGRTQLSNFTLTFHFHSLEKEMATHPSVLAWRIPGTGEPGGLPSMGSPRVRYDWSDLAAAAAKELMLLNCGVGEDSWESLGLQGDPTSPF